jgi:hypothetical protein
MIASSRKKAVLDFSDLSNGLNTTEDPVKIGKRQAQSCRNAILRKNGQERRPGSLFLSGTTLTTAYKGLFSYLQTNGTEKLIGVSGGKVYDINLTTGEETERYNLTGIGEAWAANALSKLFVVNGSGVMKLENETAYRVGIAPPSGCTAQAKAGGSLPDGQYQIRCCYARTENGFTLYSQGQTVSTVTLGSGNNTVEFTAFPNSSDAQVDNKVVFMTDAGGSTFYRYYATGNNTTTAFDITSTAQRNAAILYSVVAVNNTLPNNMTQIIWFDGRLWGFVNNVLYYSLKTQDNPTDLERWYAANKITYNHQITAMFVIGDNLYLNTKRGIILQPADVYSRNYYVEERWYFTQPRTIKNWNGGILGLTNDGFRFFDGEKFLNYNISKDIQTQIKQMKAPDSSYLPNAVIYKRDIREEYHVCYQDTAYSSLNANQRIVLNLDKLAFLPEKEVTAPWEVWDNGANYMATDTNGVMYNVQNHANLAPVIYTETTLNTIDNGMYLRDGSLGDSNSFIPLVVETRVELPALDYWVNWNVLRALILQKFSTTLTVSIRDVSGLNDSVTTVGTGTRQSLWDIMQWDVDLWAGNTPQIVKNKLKRNLKGAMVFIKVEQTADDPSWNLQELQLHGIAMRTRFT